MSKVRRDNQIRLDWQIQLPTHASLLAVLCFASLVQVKTRQLRITKFLEYKAAPETLNLVHESGCDPFLV